MTTPNYGPFPAASYGVSEVAATILPLPTGTGKSLLFDADAPLAYLLEFWAAMLQNYLAARYAAAAAAAAPALPATVIAPGSTYPYDVTPYLPETQFAFPLLAVWRKSSDVEMLTAGHEHTKTMFGAAYILPPLDAGQAEQMLPILGAAQKVLTTATTRGWDPSYIPTGGTSPTPGPFLEPYAHVEGVWIKRTQYGRFPGTGNLWFPTLLIDVLVKERDNFPPLSVTGYQPMQGGDIDVALVSSDGSTIDQFVQVATLPAPTLATLSVGTGPYTGGTTVVLVGTGFQTPTVATSTAPAVLFGTLAATSIKLLSPSTLSCVTPAFLGPGPFTVGVTVVNPDGQTATLPASFVVV